MEITLKNDRCRHERLSASRRVRSENEFQLRNDLGVLNGFASDYSKLVVTNAHGESTVLYDASESTLASMIIRLVLALAFTTICILVVKENKLKKKKEES